MTALRSRWRSYFLAMLFAAGCIPPPIFAQEADVKPDAPTPKIGQAAGALPTKAAVTPGKSEPEPELVPDLPALATKLLEYAKFESSAEKNCKIVVANFTLPDGNTSQFGMRLADELSKEMASLRSDFQLVDRRFVQDFLIKDRVPEKSINAGVIRAIASASSARFVVVGTTTKMEGDVVQLSAVLFELTDKDWNGYSAAVKVAAPKESDAMLPSEPFGPLPVLAFAGNGESLYQSGANGVSLPSCIYMPNPPYSEEARKFKVSGFIVTEAVLNTEGRLENLRISRGLPGGLNETTLATMKTWRCRPAQMDGKNVPVRIQFEVNFRLY